MQKQPPPTRQDDMGGVRDMQRSCKTLDTNVPGFQLNQSESLGLVPWVVLEVNNSGTCEMGPWSDAHRYRSLCGFPHPKLSHVLENWSRTQRGFQRKKSEPPLGSLEGLLRSASTSLLVSEGPVEEEDIA